jgi:3-dehydroquinate dehydratase-2
MAPKILVLNGPNLNLLGTREPDIYGSETLADIEVRALKFGVSLGLQVEFRQSNAEGQLVDWVQQAQKNISLLIINAGAYTHTSVALLDALKACGIPVIEVHLSNIFQREEFRQHSYISKVALGTICGFGGYGYEMALEAAARMLNK